MDVRAEQLVQAIESVGGTITAVGPAHYVIEPPNAPGEREKMERVLVQIGNREPFRGDLLRYLIGTGRMIGL
ncbi:hypothetical protein [Chthonobacter rhizosphaerae]|uniref:hypothetical protein n=1 Tax=Chthonobacter rhizosphaerae TaxID=2735553 RepID=UPI0015EF9F6A|nr:hypothetical protein [Chthonobacter rhizosphaerae]